MDLGLIILFVGALSFLWGSTRWSVRADRVFALTIRIYGALLFTTGSWMLNIGLGHPIHFGAFDNPLAFLIIGLAAMVAMSLIKGANAWDWLINIPWRVGVRAFVAALCLAVATVYMANACVKFVADNI